MGQRDYHLEDRRQREQVQRGTRFGTRAIRIDQSAVKVGTRQIIGPVTLDAAGTVTETLSGLIDTTNATFTNLNVIGNVSIGGTLTLTSLNLATPLPIASGGTGTATPGDTAGTAITITGTWPNETIAYSGALTSQSDVLITSPADGDVLRYVASASKWENHQEKLDDLANVVITTPTDGQVLTYHNATSKWINAAGGGGGGGGLTDISMSGGTANTWGGRRYTDAVGGTWYDQTGPNTTLTSGKRYRFEAFVDPTGATTKSPGAVGFLLGYLTAGKHYGFFFEYWNGASPNLYTQSYVNDVGTTRDSLAGADVTSPPFSHFSVDIMWLDAPTGEGGNDVLSYKFCVAGTHFQGVYAYNPATVFEYAGATVNFSIFVYNGGSGTASADVYELCWGTP